MMHGACKMNLDDDNYKLCTVLQR